MAEAKLTPEARALLEQLKHLDDPSQAERIQGDAAVRRMLASQGLHDLPPLAMDLSASAPAPLPAAGSALAGSGSKLLWGFVGATFVAALGIVSVGALRTAEPAPGAQPETSQVAKRQQLAPPARVEPASDAPSPPSAESQELKAPPAPKHSARIPPPSRTSLAEELRFLSSLDADIRAGNYDEALRRLAKNKGHSPLQQERAAMRVLALCGRDGDKHAARARDNFLRAAPHSVLADRVRTACDWEAER